MLVKLDLLINIDHKNKTTTYLFEKNERVLLIFETKLNKETIEILKETPVSCILRMEQTQPKLCTDVIYERNFKLVSKRENPRVTFKTLEYRQTPIYIDNTLLSFFGIRVNKKLIKKALAQGI